MSILGNLIQILAILSSVIAIILSHTIYGRRLLYLSCFCSIFSFILLVYGFIISDFSIQNVFLNSSTIKPLVYKIAGSWASHEGSILLWLCLLSIINCIYLYLSPVAFLFNNHIDHLINRYQIIILSLLQLMFGSFIYFTSNPFHKLSFTPAEGLGLNPMLQDIALAIHPPILYLGYICYVVPFTVSCIILLINTDEVNRISKLLKLAKTFAHCGILAMTCGISLGSWWAYRELGWGGFWFFDPVENISLMPWLSAIALHHTISITIISRKFIYWSLNLSIITYLLSILGTFLVRSGIIVSIHSFASSPERGIYMLIIFSVIALSSIGLLAFRQLTIINRPLMFKERGIIIGNIFWLIGLLILATSVLYPVVRHLWRNELISVEYQYFIHSFIPVTIITTFLAAIFSVPKNCRKYIVTLVLAVLLTCISSIKVSYTIISASAVMAAIFLILQMLILLLTSSNYFKRMPPEKTMAMILSHAGLGLLVLSCTFNGLLQRETEFIGKVDDTIDLMQFNIQLKDIRFAKGVNYYRQIAEFWIDDNSTHKITILKPENRFYIIEQSLSQESDIFSYITHDLYAVLSRVDEDVVHAKIYYRPFISLIWLSAIIIVSGLLISLLNTLFCSQSDRQKDKHGKTVEA
nr:heme lyase CcmF/NrfE family subunit [Candidatus Trichorickettsia mobilis]